MMEEVKVKEQIVIEEKRKQRHWATKPGFHHDDTTLKLSRIEGMQQCFVPMIANRQLDASSMSNVVK